MAGLVPTLHKVESVVTILSAVPNWNGREGAAGTFLPGLNGPDVASLGQGGVGYLPALGTWRLSYDYVC